MLYSYSSILHYIYIQFAKAEITAFEIYIIAYINLRAVRASTRHITSVTARFCACYDIGKYMIEWKNLKNNSIFEIYACEFLYETGRVCINQSLL